MSKTLGFLQRQIPSVLPSDASSLDPNHHKSLASSGDSHLAPLHCSHGVCEGELGGSRCVYSITAMSNSRQTLSVIHNIHTVYGNIKLGEVTKA